MEASLGLKGWFRGGGSKQAGQEYSIDDLIVLERYDEAAERLKGKLKTSPDDLHSHLKLAEVYAELKQFDRAVDEFNHVAEEYAQDGFYDKGIALLSKAMKLAPMDQSLRLRIDKIQREKSLEQVRALALEGLRQAGGQKAGTSALELQRVWHHLAGSSLVQHLPGEPLKRLFANMELLHLPAKTELVAEGARDAWMLLVVRGVIDAWVLVSGRESTVRSFTSGDLLGEAVLLEHGSWPASYRVAEDAMALKLTREGLERALVGNPDPRALLDALREQHNDRDVAASLRRLRSVS